MIFYNNVLAKSFLKGKKITISESDGSFLPDTSIWKFGKTWSFKYMKSNIGNVSF